MKTILNTLTTLSVLLAPFSLHAHSGHISESGWHGLLHAEHIMVLAAAALLAAIVIHNRNN